MDILCLDLEGVLVPEVWQAVADETQIPELLKTTRDIPNYDDLMRYRLAIIEQNDITLSQVQAEIAKLAPLPGAADFLRWARRHFQVAIISDTFYEFAQPFMKQLDWPTLLCHRLEVDDDRRVANYVLRQKDPKRNAVKALKKLNFIVYAAGDSYNDTTMLEEADAGFLFRAPENVVQEFPQYPLITEYDDLLKHFDKLA